MSTHLANELHREKEVLVQKLSEVVKAEVNNHVERTVAKSVEQRMVADGMLIHKLVDSAVKMHLQEDIDTTKCGEFTIAKILGEVPRCPKIIKNMDTLEDVNNISGSNVSGQTLEDVLTSILQKLATLEHDFCELSCIVKKLQKSSPVLKHVLPAVWEAGGEKNMKVMEHLVKRIVDPEYIARGMDKYNARVRNAKIRATFSES